MILHPAVKGFVEQFEREAVLSGSLRKKVGELDLAFLEQVWAPAFGYDFSGLQVEYSFKDFKEDNDLPILFTSTRYSTFIRIGWVYNTCSRHFTSGV